MRKYITLLMFALLPTMLMAQEANNNGNKGFDPESHKQKQHAFMKESAQLTDEEAERFFAIYDEMRTKERQIYGDSHKMRNKLPQTDEECREAMLHADSLELAIKQLQYDYHLRLLNAVSPKKACIAIMNGQMFDRMALRDMFGGRTNGNPIAKKGGRSDKKGPRPEFMGPRPDVDAPGMPPAPREDMPLPEPSGD